jgi:hypothetical protein
MQYLLTGWQLRLGALRLRIEFALEDVPDERDRA